MWESSVLSCPAVKAHVEMSCRRWAEDKRGACFHTVYCSYNPFARLLDDLHGTL